MGYYVYFEIKELKLHSEGAREIIPFLNAVINEKNFDFKLPDHKLFKLERCLNLFMNSSSVGFAPVFKQHSVEYWKLRLKGEINYGWGEIDAFADWIGPYVCGHKPKEYIGWVKGERAEDSRINLYIHRAIKHNDPPKRGLPLPADYVKMKDVAAAINEDKK